MLFYYGFFFWFYQSQEVIPWTLFTCLAKTLKEEIDKLKIYKETLSSGEKKKQEKAMQEEYNSLLGNKTRDEMSTLERQKVLESKWVYKIKKTV